MLISLSQKKVKTFPWSRGHVLKKLQIESDTRILLAKDGPLFFDVTAKLGDALRASETKLISLFLHEVFRGVNGIDDSTIRQVSEHQVFFSRLASTPYVDDINLVFWRPESDFEPDCFCGIKFLLQSSSETQASIDKMDCLIFRITEKFEFLRESIEDAEAKLRLAKIPKCRE